MKSITIVSGTDTKRIGNATGFAVSGSAAGRIKIEDGISGSNAIVSEVLFNNDATTATTWGNYGIIPITGPLQVSMSSGHVIVFAP